MTQAPMRKRFAFLMLAFSGATSAGSVTYIGCFTDDELCLLDFTRAGGGPLAVTTDSFAAGGFTTGLSPFDGTGQLAAVDAGSMQRLLTYRAHCASATSVSGPEAQFGSSTSGGM
jgi:hypothetical protein